MSDLSDVSRPLVRWFGGKWRLAPWIVEHFPPHRVYVEPYGGGGSILLRKPRSYAEVYNDLDVEIVNLFRVVRDPILAPKLIEALYLTPFAREEFKAAYHPSDDPVERARHLVILSFMGFGSNAHNGRSTGFRANSNRSGTTPSGDWANYPEALTITIDRLRGVVIENRPAIEVMDHHDGVETLHYVDPPYVTETRPGSSNAYNHEMDDGQHVELLAFLRTLKGGVILSGYAHPMYDEQLGDWKRIERAHHADGARERTEVLWINPRAAANGAAPQLF